MNEEDPQDRQHVAHRRTLRFSRQLILVGLLLPILLVALSCEKKEEAKPADVAVLDSFLVELGRLPSASLNREQRWRMISSIWVGLPPPGYSRDSLPDATSHSAALLQVFCVQCHWMPSPQMHAAGEWPLLVRRMLLRAHTVQNRMGGPLTSQILGSARLMGGMGVIQQPGPQEVDSLVAYLQRHALPVAKPGEIPENADGALFQQKCSVCHATPSPRAHTAAGWRQMMPRMVANMAAMGIGPLVPEEITRIQEFLTSQAAQ